MSCLLTSFRIMTRYVREKTNFLWKPKPPDPSPSEPSPSSSEPSPSEPDSPPSEPNPSPSEPNPSSSEPKLSSSEPNPSYSKPNPSSSEPNPSSSEPDSPPSEPNPSSSEPAPGGARSALATYLDEQRALLHAFESQFDDSEPRPGDNSISDSWKLAWRRLREELNLYKYRSLEAATEEHRVLLIHPSSSYLDTIRVSIDYVFFSEGSMPEYEALSYVCGDATRDLITIQVIDKDDGSDKGELEIGQNLSVALRYLRLTERARTIWCDALCINQQDNSEKSAEILKMSDIYVKAKRVIIWLGPESDKSGIAIKHLSHVGKQVKMDWRWEHFGMGVEEGKDPRWAYGNYPLPFDRTTWHSIKMLISRPWFERLWVWQEATLAQENDAIMLCGRDEMRWDDFRQAIMCLYFNTCDPDIPPSELRLYRSKLEHASQLARCKIQTNTTGILSLTKNCRCFDPRDRVYAVLSFVDSLNPISPYITPDYRKTKKQVYLELFLAVYQNFGSSLTMLALSQAGKGDTPTWLPDYEVLGEHSYVLHGWASGRSAGIFSTLDSESSIARLSGVSCGIVELCSRPMPIQPSREEIITVAKEWLRESLSSATYPTGLCPLDVFVLTIMRNGIREHHFGPLSRPTFLQARKIVLRDFAEERATNYIDMHYGTPPWYLFFYIRLGDNLPGFSFGKLTNGHFGLLPPKAMPGDHVYTILGCPAPLVLRKQENGNFTVVGSCYLNDHMEAQALLGEVPDNYRVVFRDGDIEGGMWFLEVETMSASRIDPRLGSLPPGWNQICYSDGQLCWIDPEGGLQHCDPRLTPEALIARGVHVQDLTLE
ncbi:hypothetical protein HDV57DRAFT_509950 [Trichoderma longibrachiatum]